MILVLSAIKHSVDALPQCEVERRCSLDAAVLERPPTLPPVTLPGVVRHGGGGDRPIVGQMMLSSESSDPSGRRV